MDSDDTISEENGRKLRNLADQPLDSAPTAYVMQVHCPGPSGSSDCTVVDHVKMFRNDERLRFEGRIHEQILPAIRRIDGTIGWTDIFVTHSGAEHTVEAKRLKVERDLYLLQLELKEHPDHPFVLFNLGMTYADIEDFEPAVDHLKRCLLASSPDESHVRKAYALLVGCLTQAGHDGEARQILSRGRELYPNDSELWFRLAILEHRKKNHREAIDAYHAAIEAREQCCFSSRDHGITGFKARHNLAGVYADLGQLDHAELQWRLALDDEPRYSEGFRGLIELLLSRGKYLTAEAEIVEAETRGLPADAIAHARARLAATRGDFETALNELDAALESTESIELLRLKCELAFEHSTLDSAIRALEALCRRAPDDGAAWHNLGTAYQKAGCNSLAEISYHKSLVLRPNYQPTLVQLGYVHQALGRHELARRVWVVAGHVVHELPVGHVTPAEVVGSDAETCYV
jgi:tetratricopeptide (TPR) repeat protein